MGILGTQIYIGDLEVKESSIFIGDTLSSINPTITPDTLPTDGLVFHLDANDYVSGSSTWLSSAGSKPITGSIATNTYMPVVTNNAGKTITLIPSQSINIEPRTELDYGELEYTLFLVARYSGSAGNGKYKRILVSGATATGEFLSYNTLLGTYDGSTSAAHTNTSGFIINSGSFDNQWRLYTLSATGSIIDSPTSKRADLKYYQNGQFITKSQATGSLFGYWGFKGLGINTGSFQDGPTNSPSYENSNCEIGEVFMYDKVLSDSEVAYIYDVVKTRYSI
jgi:hypothetical protein